MSMKKTLILIPLFILGLFLSTCTKDVDIDFPDVESKVVVDGNITLGSAPFLFLTQSQSFNAPLDPTNLQGLFVNGAEVSVSNGTDTVYLEEICASELSDEELAIAAEAIGIDPEALQQIDYCIYFDLTQSMIGEEGKDYFLKIKVPDGRELSAETHIHSPVPLDSIWFEYWADSDSLGFLHARVTDPAGVRNAYRWRAQRINSYANGEQKDFGMIAPIGSTFEDRFLDGLNIEIFYNRGSIPNSSAEDDNNEEAGYFKFQDTVLVEFSATTLAVYDYVTLSDDQLVNNGSPFAVPANLPSNVTGGLGLWAGYAPIVEEVVCVP